MKDLDEGKKIMDGLKIAIDCQDEVLIQHWRARLKRLMDKLAEKEQN